MWGRDKPSGKGEVAITNDDRTYSYTSDIKLGLQYRDTVTKIEGRATLIQFFEHACERVVLEYVKDGDLKELAFDAVRLQAVASGTPARVDKTGGPDRGTATRSTPSR